MIPEPSTPNPNSNPWKMKYIFIFIIRRQKLSQHTLQGCRLQDSRLWEKGQDTLLYAPHTPLHSNPLFSVAAAFIVVIFSSASTLMVVRKH